MSLDIYRHLEGKDENCSDVVGLYAIMPDNNCAFLCTDFDDKSCKHGYKNLSLCATVIDKAIVWYGAINALGVASEEDNAIKVTDHNLADELIEVLL